MYQAPQYQLVCISVPAGYDMAAAPSEPPDNRLELAEENSVKESMTENAINPADVQEKGANDSMPVDEKIEPSGDEATVLSEFRFETEDQQQLNEIIKEETPENEFIIPDFKEETRPTSIEDTSILGDLSMTVKAEPIEELDINEVFVDNEYMVPKTLPAESITEVVIEEDYGTLPEEANNPLLASKEVGQTQEKRNLKKVPKKPKAFRSAYAIFSTEMMNSVKIRASRKRMAEIGRLWRELPPSKQWKYEQKLQDILKNKDVGNKQLKKLGCQHCGRSFDTRLARSGHLRWCTSKGKQKETPEESAETQDVNESSSKSEEVSKIPRKKKMLKGEPKQPPKSGYAVFSIEMMKSTETKYRVTELGRLWKTLERSEQEKYTEKLGELSRKYREDLAKFLEALSDEEREEYYRFKEITMPVESTDFIVNEKEKPKRNRKRQLEEGNNQNVNKSSSKSKEVTKIPRKKKMLEGEPKLPPKSGYAVFCNEMLRCDDNNYSVRAIGKLWRALELTEQEKYRDMCHDLSRKYSDDLAKFLEGLSEEDQIEYYKIKKLVLPFELTDAAANATVIPKEKQKGLSEEDQIEKIKKLVLPVELPDAAANVTVIPKEKQKVGTQRAQQQTRRKTIVSAETKRIALKRISQGESQTQIAKELGVVQSAVAYWVKTMGKECSPDVEEEAVERNLDPEFIVSDGQSSSFSEQNEAKETRSSDTATRKSRSETLCLQKELPCEGGESGEVDDLFADNSDSTEQHSTSKSNEEKEASSKEILGTKSLAALPSEEKEVDEFESSSKDEQHSAASKQNAIEIPFKPCKCYICEKIFSSPNHLKHHLSIHREEKQFECSECGKKCSSYNTLKRHLSNHSKEKHFDCGECGKKFISYHFLTQHQVMHSGLKPYKCDMCGKCYARAGDLRKHCKSHTNQSKCVICTKILSRRSHLKQHLWKQHGLILGTHGRFDDTAKHLECEVVTGKTMKSTKSNAEIQCQFSNCGESFETLILLRRHYSEVHKGEKQYACEFCQDRFSSTKCLVLHLRKHTGEKPFKCSVCGKEFVCNWDLKVHQINHSEVKKHLCSVCGKCFARKGELDSHFLVHTGEKKHKCDVCQKAFSRRTHLTTHLRRHTGEKPYYCDICDKSFSYALLQHRCSPKSNTFPAEQSKSGAKLARSNNKIKR